MAADSEAETLVDLTAQTDSDELPDRTMPS